MLVVVYFLCLFFVWGRGFVGCFLFVLFVLFWCFFGGEVGAKVGILFYLYYFGRSALKTGERVFLWMLLRVTERERNVLFNDALNTFYLRLYGVRHMVKDHSDSEKGNPLPPHRLLLSISSKGSFICTIPQTRYHIPWPL